MSVENYRDQLNALAAAKGLDRPVRVLFAAAECAPLAKTGGLADVVGALPAALAELGFDARVITPYHRCIKDAYASQVEHLTHIHVDLGWRHEYAGLERLCLPGLTVYLVDSEYYFGDRIYRGGPAEVEQYAFFQRAVLELLPMLPDFAPEVLHCNDWHTAMLPFLLKTQYRDRPQGSVSKLRTFSDGFKVLGTIGKLFKDYKPLPFFSLISLILMGIALVLLFPVLVEYHRTGLVPRLPTFVAACFMALFSLQTFVCGLILDTQGKKSRQQFELHMNLIAMGQERNEP